MADNKQVSIIREQGEFSEPIPLTEQENETVNESQKNDKE